MKHRPTTIRDRLGAHKVIRLLCTLGSVEKIHMPRQIDPDKSGLANQTLFERIVADDRADQKRGRPLRQIRNGFKLFARLDLIPGKTNTLMGRMNANSHSYIRAEEEALLTLNWHCVGQKPS